MYGQISDFKWLDSCVFSLLVKEGFAVYTFPAEPLSHELTQMSGLKHEVCWSNSRQHYTHLVWRVWHCSFATLNPWIQILYFSHKQNNLLHHHVACMQLPCSPKISTSHCSNLIWVNRLFKGNQNGTSPDIFPSEKSNLCKLVEWHPWCRMHASLCSISDNHLWVHQYRFLFILPFNTMCLFLHIYCTCPLPCLFIDSKLDVSTIYSKNITLSCVPHQSMHMKFSAYGYYSTEIFVLLFCSASRIKW